MSDIIKVTLDYNTMRVLKVAYVAAKTRQLRAFGYRELEQAEVATQLELVLEGKTLGTGLTVIGGFIAEDKPELV